MEVYYVIGDSIAPRTISEAVAAGIRIGNKIGSLETSRDISFEYITIDNNTRVTIGYLLSAIKQIRFKLRVTEVI
ncbi:hypothetical protein [Alkalihalobacillus sp. TS-13]|uniref:hypothetical protein n=1 Tax=Alkalihalobacillus sp. TS-13 TaxID=2842455 RepID=UPI001C880635|nr:hypothetical protein [Alkalihalobacillus sp. TS-13]